MKDWLGQEYDVGDKVIYAALSGRSVTMVLAEVVEIYQGPAYGYAGYGRELTPDETETKVKVQPIKSSRWKQHTGRTRYVDERSGKGINPYGGKHSYGYYFENDQTGERVTYDESKLDHRFDRSTHTQAPEGWRWVPGGFKPYVKRIKEGPAPVTLTVTENIVKWNGKA